MDSPGSGWKSFAGVILVVVGFFNAIDGLVALFNANRLSGVTAGSANLPVTTNLQAWGWLVLIIGVVLIFAGFGVFTGALWARTVAIFAVSFNLVVQFTYSAHYPLWSLMVITIDVLLLYGLVVHGAPDSEQ